MYWDSALFDTHASSIMKSVHVCQNSLLIFGTAARAGPAVVEQPTIVCSGRQPEQMPYKLHVHVLYSTVTRIRVMVRPAL